MRSEPSLAKIVADISPGKVLSQSETEILCTVMFQSRPGYHLHCQILVRRDGSREPEFDRCVFNAHGELGVHDMRAARRTGAYFATGPFVPCWLP
jgi:hypothetical protein